VDGKKKWKEKDLSWTLNFEMIFVFRELTLEKREEMKREVGKDMFCFVLVLFLYIEKVV